MDLDMNDVSADVVPETTEDPLAQLAGLNILYVDTETSGIVSNKKPLNSPDQAWIVQVGMIHDLGCETQGTTDFIIKGGEREMGPFAQKVHGISLAKSNEVGLDEAGCVERLAEDFKYADMIVGHNISFDLKMFQAFFARNDRMDMVEHLLSAQTICTMNLSKEFCALPMKRGKAYKAPKLEELFDILFGGEFEGAHSALGDITATRKCFLELLKREIIIL